MHDIHVRTYVMMYSFHVQGLSLYETDHPKAPRCRGCSDLPQRSTGVPLCRGPGAGWKRCQR